MQQTFQEHTTEKLVENLLYIFTSFTMGTAILTPESQILICNDPYLKLLEIQWETKLTDAFPDLKTVLCATDQQMGQRIHWLKEKEILFCISPITWLKNKTWNLCFIFDQVTRDLNDMKTREMENLITQLDGIIDCTTEGIWVSDGDGNVLRVNPVSAEMNNLNASDIIGKNMRDLEAAGYFKGCATLDALKYRKTITSLVPLYRTNTMVIATAKPFFDEAGNLTMVVGTERDISKLEDQHHSLREQAELQNSLKARIDELSSISTFSEYFIAKSESMIRVLNKVIKVSAVKSTVLILGESGVGKTAIAEMIHKNSPRKEHPFFAINCSAIPETLLESELFGYDQGAFTGAKKLGKAGLIEMANKGTLFLDEISEISIASQSKLLKFLDEGCFFRVGSTSKKVVDVRIIAATNQDLKVLIDQGAFRLDLYYRLNVISLLIPPLRDRYNCITALIKHYIDHFASAMESKRKLSPKAFSILANYHFPGNVRELINICERTVVMADSEYVMPSDLPREVLESANVGLDDQIEPTEGESLPEFIGRVEKQVLLKTQQAHGNQKQMAAALGVTQPTINRKMKKYGIKSFDKSEQ